MNVWVEAPPQETATRRSERLVLHGLRCGKHSIAALSYHIGSDSKGVDARDALERLEKRGKVKRTERGWELA
jgi:hypothetical protein